MGCPLFASKEGAKNPWVGQIPQLPKGTGNGEEIKIGKSFSFFW